MAHAAVYECLNQMPRFRHCCFQSLVKRGIGGPGPELLLSMFSILCRGFQDSPAVGCTVRLRLSGSRWDG